MRALAAVLVLASAASSGAAQTLPSEPVTLGEGRVVLGADVAVSLAPEDRGFFNYSDYEHSTLRQVRLGMRGLVRVTERISVLGELRSENLDHVAPVALYARVRPFPRRRLDIQIGRIPPTFGSYSRNTYSRDNPLIGTPLAYQYLISLRADAIPADADELLRMRGRGWLSNFTIGNAAEARGVPLVSSFTWDTGVQVTGGWKMLTAAGAVTTGTLSNPRVTDDNAGKQIAFRVEAVPAAGLRAGTSFAAGDFLSRSVRSAVTADPRHDYGQRAHGVDAEYSHGHLVVRADAVLSRWNIPFVAESAWPVALRALATSLEGRYTLAPGFYVAARVEHLGFNRIAGSARSDEWEAPVTRVETGGGYSIQRNLLARLSMQVNRRDGGRVRSATMVSGQILFWF